MDFQLLARSSRFRGPQKARSTGRKPILFLLGCVLLLLLWQPRRPACGQSEARFRALRQRMVENFIRRAGVTDRRVLQAMKQVPRHRFVPARLRQKAYQDGALPIGHKQTISPPFIVAYMTATLDPQADDRVLEIGTGSGYQAAVLSGLVKEVYTIEIVEPLGRQAEQRLNRLGYDNVHVKVGDGFQGWPEKAPFDKIIVTCSPEDVPQPLIDQLADGGKMIIPLGRRYQQVFHLFTKTDGKLSDEKLIPTLFVPMTGISEEKRDKKPDPLNPQIVNGDFEKDANNDGRPDGWHYQRQSQLGERSTGGDNQTLCFTNAERGRAAQALQGMAVDGRKVRTVQVSLLAKTRRTAPGPKPFQKPGLLLHFYDGSRAPIGEAALGPWLGSRGWQRYSRTIRIPPQTREMIVRIGLNGATGRLCVDDIQLSVSQR